MNCVIASSKVFGVLLNVMQELTGIQLGKLFFLIHCHVIV